MWRRHHIVVCALCMTGLMATAEAVHAQQLDLVLGGALMRGTLQTPYISNCSDDPESRAGGNIIYAGLGFGAVSATAGYTYAGEADSNEECIVSPPPPDGVQRVREFPRRTRSFWGWAFHLRYTPQSLPLMAYVGTGFEFEGNEFRTLGIALRTRGRFSVFGGVEVMQLRTPYVRYENEWQNGSVISSVEVERGHAWRKLEVIRVGVEYRLRLIGGE